MKAYRQHDGTDLPLRFNGSFVGRLNELPIKFEIAPVTSMPVEVEFFVDEYFDVTETPRYEIRPVRNLISSIELGGPFIGGLEKMTEPESVALVRIKYPNGSLDKTLEIYYHPATS